MEVITTNINKIYCNHESLQEKQKYHDMPSLLVVHLAVYAS